MTQPLAVAPGAHSPLGAQPCFSQRIVAWQRACGRNELPWVGQAAYEVWLSEIMLQQTQVRSVLPYYARFLALYPSVQQLAQAPIDDVLAAWAGLGYYSRARNLHACAQRIVAVHGGQFPSDPKALQALPGIGPSTAAAVASLAHHQRAAILDGNVKRVIARHAGVVGWPGVPAVAKQLWAQAHARLIEASSPVASDHHRRYTQGLMDLGATVCTAKQPRCGQCPVHADCAARLNGAMDTIPAPRPKKTVPIQSRCALIVHTTQGVWLERRAAKGLWGGLLSFPEAQSQHDLAQWALGAGLATRSADMAAQLQSWHTPTLKHTFTHYQLHWQLWALSFDENRVLPKPWAFVRWSDVSRAGVPKAVLKALRR